MPFSPKAYLNVDGFEHARLFEGIDQVWQALGKVDEYLKKYISNYQRKRNGTGGSSLIQGTVMPGAWVADDVVIAPDVLVEPGAMIQGPTVIGRGTVIRHGAYIRGSCVIGSDCIIGHATELKKAIMLDGAQAPHFNYVGDSILGRGVNLGAGTRLSNFKNDGSVIEVRKGEQKVSTSMRKFGAVVGDEVKTGCNCVTSPGTLIGPGSMVYANAVLRGVYPPRSIIKLRQELIVVERR